MGHSCQCISLLVQGIGAFFAVPLVSRIHEGVVFSNLHCQTLLDKLVHLLLGLCIQSRFYLVADAYFASKKVALPLLAVDPHLVVRLHSNALAYRPITEPQQNTAKGRPRRYGDKLKLRDLFADPEMLLAFSPVYNESGLVLRYRSLQLLWRPLGRVVHFVLVQHPRRGKLVLLSTDCNLPALKVIELYGLRFKIEVSFHQAVDTIGTYSYHFWMMDMKPTRRGDGTQYLHRATKTYRQHVCRKMDAYHRYIQLAIIVQGLLQYLAVQFPSHVWNTFRSWLRTMHRSLAPSEMVVACALRSTFPLFLFNSPDAQFFKNFVGPRLDLTRCPDLLHQIPRLAA